MLCPKCKKMIPDGSRFCLECGSTVSSDSQAEAAQAAARADLSLGAGLTLAGPAPAAAGADASLGGQNTLQGAGIADRCLPNSPTVQAPRVARLPPDELFMYAGLDVLWKIVGVTAGKGLTGQACSACRGVWRAAGIAAGTGYLKATPPNRLNDPFECCPAAAAEVSEASRNMSTPSAHGTGDAVAEESGQKDSPTIGSQTSDGAHTGSRGFVYASSRRQDSAEFLDLYGPRILDRVSADYGLICFAERVDCLLMWSYYARGHAGVCIGFSRTQLSGTGRPQWLPVQYSAHRRGFVSCDSPRDQFQENARRVITTKAGCWSHEAEWRLLVRLRQCAEQCGMRLWPFPLAAVTRVIFGCKCELSQGDTASLAELREVRPTLVVQRARPDPREYRLLIEPLGS
jgi:hypothetical protein